ncbi:MAG: hypothetical protein ACOCWK_10270, partial [Tangfeifania sp.]
MEPTSQKTIDPLRPINADEENSVSKGERNIFDVLEGSVFKAVETYSNVHRGSGHFSIISTLLFERAREVVLEYLQLDKSSYVVVFCTPRGADRITKTIEPQHSYRLNSSETGLALGVSVLAINKTNC